MRKLGLFLSLLAVLAWVGCGDEGGISSPTQDPSAKLTVSAIKAGGYEGYPRSAPSVYKSMLVYAPIHPTLSSVPPQVAAQVIGNMDLNHVVFGGVSGYVPAQLNPIIDELHRRGIKCYGEVTQFAGWDAAIPESQPTLATGELMPQVEWYQGANPSVPAVFDKAVANFKKAADDFPELDGLYMDFIRWPIHWEVRDWEEGTDPYTYETSFDAATLARFQAATGVVIPATLTTIPQRAAWIRANAYDRWAAWKCSIITEFCRIAHDYLKAQNPNKVLGAFTVPWRPSDYNGAITKIVGQDYAAMAQYVEMWSPMEYYDMMDYTIPWMGDFATYTKQVTGQTTIPVIMGYSISRDKYGDTLTPEELRSSILTTAQAPGSDGVMMFWYASILDEGRLDEVVRTYAVLR